MSKYDMKFNKFIVELILKDENQIKDISKLYNISIPTLYRWKTKYKLHGNSSFVNHNSNKVKIKYYYV